MFLSDFYSNYSLTLIILVLTALLFYLIIPVMGAFYVRKSWRTFRSNLRKALTFPMVHPGVRAGTASLGFHRFLGELEAIEGDDLLWIKGDPGTITADMRNARVYNMTGSGINMELHKNLYPYPLPKTALVQMSWNDIFSLTEGTRLFLFGSLSVENGKYCLKSSDDLPLTVIIYNEDPFTLIPRAIWCGRHRNEFWNFITPWSVLTGTLLLLIFSVLILQNSSNYALNFISLFLSFVPLILFLPPGVFFINLYKYYWNKGRQYRGERDLIRLPRGFGHKSEDCEGCRIAYSRQPSAWKGKGKRVCCPIPEGLLQMSEKDRDGQYIAYPDDPEALAWFCQKKAFLYEALSVLVFSGGLILNFVLFWIIMLRIL